jgi:hypothetical protein
MDSSENTCKTGMNIVYVALIETCLSCSAFLNSTWNWNASVGIVRATGRKPGVRFPAQAGYVFLHSIEIGSGAQPVSNPLGSMEYFP